MDSLVQNSIPPNSQPKASKTLERVQAGTKADFFPLLLYFASIGYSKAYLPPEHRGLFWLSRLAAVNRSMLHEFV